MSFGRGFVQNNWRKTELYFFNDFFIVVTFHALARFPFACAFYSSMLFWYSLSLLFNVVIRGLNGLIIVS